LEQPRKPCYVLDAIDTRLKDVIVGRCGYMASILQEGTIRPGMRIKAVHDVPAEDVNQPQSWNAAVKERGAVAFVG
jgi:MOSC domain-containing protein YiiM